MGIASWDSMIVVANLIMTMWDKRLCATSVRGGCGVDALIESAGYEDQMSSSVHEL